MQRSLLKSRLDPLVSEGLNAWVVAGQSPALVDETVAVAVVGKEVLDILSVSISNLDVSRVIWVVGDEVWNVQQVSLVHYVVLSLD